MSKKNTEHTIEQDFLKPEEYHFSGGGEYVPVTVKASSMDEAIEEWEKVRVPVVQESTAAPGDSLQDKSVVE